MSKLKEQIEADCRKTMNSIKGDKVDSFTKRRMAMMTDETTEATGSYKEVTEGQASENIKMSNMAELAAWTTKKKSDGVTQYVSTVKGKYGEADLIIIDDPASEDGVLWAVHGDDIQNGYAKTVDQAKTIAVKKAHDDVDSSSKNRPSAFR